jgi:GGDEF domain-containing protein
MSDLVNGLSSHPDDLSLSRRSRQAERRDEITVLTPVARLAEQFGQALLAQESDKLVAILLAEIDGLPADGDTGRDGHAGGDLLGAVAGRLSTLLRPGDGLARVSDTEIVIFCLNLNNAGAVRELTDHIDSVLNGVFALAGRTVAVSSTVSGAVAGSGDQIPFSLVRDPAGALRRATRRGVDGPHIIDLTGEA